MQDKEKTNWFSRLQARWGVTAKRAIIILIVFACTGFTVLFLKEPLLNLLIGESEKTNIHRILYFILILPIYNILLLIYGFIFGQFQFFWDFEKRFLNRLIGRKENSKA